VTNGILLALLAYASFSWGDAVIKALGGQLSVFEIGFFSTLFAGVFVLFAKPRGERWRYFWKMERPVAVQARALSGIAAGVLGIYAFTTIPLAEAYSLIFLSPLFVTILSILVLGEKVGPWRWLAIAAGFAGVLLVVQPGFRDLELGHLAAALIAVLAAVTVILLRSLAREKRTSLLGVMILYGLVFNGAAASLTSFSLPDAGQLGLLALVGVFSGVGQIGLLFATRFADANRIAPTHYSQMLWAVALGALFFQEYTDPLALLGMAVIGASGLLTLVRENVRLGAVRWNPFRNRL
jgi:drug/metabolite transporter (DMT)-like permease